MSEPLAEFEVIDVEVLARPDGSTVLRFTVQVAESATRLVFRLSREDTARLKKALPE